MKKSTRLYSVITVLVIAGLILYLVYSKEISRAIFAATLFSGAEQYENFNRMAELFPVSEMSPSDKPYVFPAGEPIDLPSSFLYDGQSVDTNLFLSETDTSALLVLKEGKIVFEKYWLTGGGNVQWMSMSVAKSFTSALIGIAVEEGFISSIQDPIDRYVPSLENSGYAGVSIKNILQMSSGARWNEDYSDPNSDVNQFGKILAIGGTFEEFTSNITNELEPGSFNRYNSADTAVLGLLLVKSTERSIAGYMEEKLWHPLGMEHAGYWLIDSDGVEMAFGGLNATARDYAKFGELFRNRGQWQGKTILPGSWVSASTRPDAPHLVPGDNPASDYEMGYGYQWWVHDGDEGEFSAIGIYNQFIYVNPARDVVIVKLSAFSDYGTTSDDVSYREFETIEFFRAVTSG